MERFYNKQETKNFVDQKHSKAKNSQDSYLWVHKAIKKPTEHLGEKFTYHSRASRKSNRVNTFKE